MKAYYYYDRDSGRRPIITHCLIKNGTLLSKGVAKCSKQDSPCKKQGRHIAHERALQAMKNNCSAMDKGKKFWKKISHDLIFSHLTDIDKRILSIDTFNCPC